MRGCFMSIFLVPALLLIAGWFLLPSLASGVVTAGLGFVGFAGSDEEVTVSADPPVELLGLHADRIRIRATNASFHELRFDSLDVTLGDVGLLDRTAGSVKGTFTGVRFTPVSGPTVAITSVAVTGSGTNMRATLTISTADLRALAVAAVKENAGAAPSKVTFAAPDRATIVVGGQTVAGRLVVDAGGGLVFRPTTTPAGFDGPIDLIRPGPGVPFRLRSIALTSAGATIAGTLDPSIFGG
jgi:hypothetical protein